MQPYCPHLGLTTAAQFQTGSPPIVSEHLLCFCVHRSLCLRCPGFPNLSIQTCRFLRSSQSLFCAICRCSTHSPPQLVTRSEMRTLHLGALNSHTGACIQILSRVLFIKVTDDFQPHPLHHRGTGIGTLHGQCLRHLPRLRFLLSW